MSAATGNRKSSAAGRTFLLVNLFVFPAVGFLVPLAVRALVAVGVPVKAVITLSVLVGVALVALNAWLTWRAWRSEGASTAAVAMGGWTLLCVITLILLGSYSPLTFALALIVTAI